ncbi:MAG: histidine--tRNA ligase [Methanobrevibacter sp.]|nr:histidine--tRNA ligase [Methanobrevibacter sp.]
MIFTKPRGTRDFLFDEMKERKKVENILRDTFEVYAYQEIKTPLFEDLSLFTTKSGEEIIDQLYNFKDKSKREIALRPELTAPVARLYLNEMQKTAKPIKLYYFGSCFRYERPQKGRFRQFWQFGCELIGANSPEGEAEVIAMAEDSLNKLGIATAEIHINHLGIIRGLFKHFNIDVETQEKIMTLIDKGDKELLKSRLLANNVNINDNENKNNNNNENSIEPLIDDENLANILIKLLDFVGKDDVLKELESLLGDYEETKNSLNEFKELITLLESFKVSNYTINLGVARGLDYYTGIVFEIYVPELGAQKQIAGGGSYNLVEIFGGEKIESTGFAFGFDRLMNAMEDKKDSNSVVDVFVAPMSDETRLKSFEIGQILRNKNISTEIDLSRKNLKKLLNRANKLNVKYVILVGKDDLEENNVMIKDMATGNQETVAIDKISDNINN